MNDLNTEFRLIISHRMLGYDCDMSKFDFDGMLDDCVIAAKKEIKTKIKQLEAEKKQLLNYCLRFITNLK